MNYLKTQWIAPLGAFSLIFNFIFGSYLVGLRITRFDLYGTAVVVASVIIVVVFGAWNAHPNKEDELSLEELKLLFARPIFIGYFVILNVIVFVILITVFSLKSLLNNHTRKSKDPFLRGLDSIRIYKHLAILIAFAGGVLASETLLLAKSGIKLISLTLSGQNQFSDPISVVIFLLLLITALLQILCLNTGLALVSSVLVVPVFFR